MLRIHFQRDSALRGPRWPVLALLAAVTLLVVVPLALLGLAALLVAVVVFIPLGLAAMVIRGLLRAIGRPALPRDDGRSNVRVIPRDEI